MESEFKITLHMVSSLDGYIAKKDNNISWFETEDYYEKGLEPPDSKDFFKSIDAYIMGSKTYELAKELEKSYGWPYGKIPTWVLTHRNFSRDREHIQFYSGDIEYFVHSILKPSFKNVWLVGGGSLGNEFLRLNLVNEIRQTILPIILGEGLPFYKPMGRELKLHPINISAFKSGLVELHYQVKNLE